MTVLENVLSTKQKGDADQVLVERFSKGDTRAFDLLVVRYQHRILALISRFIKDQAEVEDVAQEAFIKAYRALPGFRGDSAFYTWLYRIAINTAKNHIVSRGRRPPSTDIDVNDVEFVETNTRLEDIESPEQNMARDDLKKVIDGAIDELPEDLRTAFTLREFGGLSYEEITDIMGCPVGTVRSRIFRAREALEKKIRPLIEKS